MLSTVVRQPPGIAFGPRLRGCKCMEGYYEATTISCACSTADIFALILSPWLNKNLSRVECSTPRGPGIGWLNLCCYRFNDPERMNDSVYRDTLLKVVAN